jgi:hypothetical protein
LSSLVLRFPVDTEDRQRFAIAFGFIFLHTERRLSETPATLRLSRHYGLSSKRVRR